MINEIQEVKGTVTVDLQATIGKGYNRFWNDKHRFRVLKGGKGSKKSTTTALNLIFRLMSYPDSNLLVVRRVMSTHRDSTFAELKKAQYRLNVSHLWKNTVSPMEMTYIPTGQKILFRGFDDVLKLASTTVAKGYLCWLWIEEAFEIENEDDFQKLALSVPRGEIAEHLFKQITLTFNPWSAEHWLKKRFFDTPHDDVSTYSTNYLINEFLQPDDIALFEQMKEDNPRKYAVAGLGEWGIAEGLVYENWNVGAVIIPDDEEWKWRSFYGLDFGYSNDPSAFVAFKVDPIDRRVYIFDEMYITKMLNCDIAAEIKRKGYAKERIRADCAEPKSIDDLRRLGLQRICSSVKGRDSILNGIDEISGYKITVDPKCKNTVMELSSYVYDEKHMLNGHKMPIDTNNHALDALRYGFHDVRFFKPADPKIKKRSTPEERYSRNTSVTFDDINSDWS